MAHKAIYIYFLICLISIPCVASTCLCKIKKKEDTSDKTIYQAIVASGSFMQEYLFDVKRELDGKHITLRNKEQVFTLDLTKNKLYTEHTNQLSNRQASTIIEAIELIISEYLLPNTCSNLQKVEQDNFPTEVPLLPGEFF